MTGSLSVMAGFVASAVFAASVVPMLVKAFRSKDLRSYSRGNLVLSNVGNLVYSVYVFNLPFGPIWFLHAFYIASSALMLLWSRVYATDRAARRRSLRGVAPTDAPPRISDLVAASSGA